jgi:hypothetical protein
MRQQRLTQLVMTWLIPHNSSGLAMVEGIKIAPISITSWKSCYLGLKTCFENLGALEHIEGSKKNFSLVCSQYVHNRPISRFVRGIAPNKLAQIISIANSQTQYCWNPRGKQHLLHLYSTHWSLASGWKIRNGSGWKTS